MDQNKKFSILKKIIELNLQIDQCRYCNGTGLFGVYERVNEDGIVDHAWSGEYCDKCNALGFHLPDKDFVLYFCEQCNGRGYSGYHNRCKVCDGEGVIYWIDNLRGKQNVGNL